jgi:hypothetical protein
LSIAKEGPWFPIFVTNCGDSWKSNDVDEGMSYCQTSAQANRRISGSHLLGSQ